MYLSTAPRKFLSAIPGSVTPSSWAWKDRRYSPRFSWGDVKDSPKKYLELMNFSHFFREKFYRGRFMLENVRF